MVKPNGVWCGIYPVSESFILSIACAASGRTPCTDPVIFISTKLEFIQSPHCSIRCSIDSIGRCRGAQIHHPSLFDRAPPNVLKPPPARPVTCKSTPHPLWNSPSISLSQQPPSRFLTEYYIELQNMTVSSLLCHPLLC